MQMQLRIKINKEAKKKTSFHDLKNNSNNNETKFLTKIKMKIKMIFLTYGDIKQGETKDIILGL